MKLFIVSSDGRQRTTEIPFKRHVLINIPDGLIGLDERGYVKREAQRFLYGHPDEYVVEPITSHGDVVFLNLSIGSLSSKVEA